MKRNLKPIKILILSVCAFFATIIIAFGQKPATFVIVHGAWGGSWSFKQADSIFTSKGYTIYRPNLTGQGERVHLSSPNIDLNTHILDVVNTILFENLTDIILVGHSYGGMVITGVADSVPERIKQLIYLDAFAPNDGESLMSARPDGQSIPGGRSQTNDFLVPAWVNANTPLPHDVPQSMKTFTTPVSRKNPKTLSLPATYILTVDEGKKPEDDQFFTFSQRALERGWKLVHMTSDHNPQMSKPNELVELLIREAK
jgi:Predicted hydrolases or acyltransferases (alpha/beta hydrolase superfamily)